METTGSIGRGKGCEPEGVACVMLLGIGGREIAEVPLADILDTAVASNETALVVLVDGTSESFLSGEGELDMGGEGYDSVICQVRVRFRG